MHYVAIIEGEEHEVEVIEVAPGSYELRILSDQNTALVT